MNIDVAIEAAMLEDSMTSHENALYCTKKHIFSPYEDSLILH